MSDHTHLPGEHDEPSSRYDHEGQSKPPGFWRSRTGLVTIGFLAIGGFFLVTEHRAHLIPYLGYMLPLLLIFACLPMHFMHGGHGGHGGGANSDDDRSDSGRSTPPHQH
jgi:hypothetical protein